MISFFMWVYLFHGLVPVLPFSRQRIDDFTSAFTPVYFFHGLSTFFESKIESFCNSICRYLMFLYSILLMPVYLFTGMVPCLPFFTERVLRSVTPYEEILLFVMFTFYQELVPFLSFLRLEYFFLLHQRQEIKDSSSLLFSRLSTFFTSQNVSFYKIREISRQA